MNGSPTLRRQAGLTLTLVWAVLGPGPAAGQQRAADRVLSIEAVARRVLETYPAAAAASAGRRVAESELSQAQAARIPGLAIQAGGTRFQESMIVAPLHGFDPQSPPDFDRLLVQGRAVASYTVWDGGARSARIHRSEALVDAAGAVEAATAGLLIERAVRAYLEVASSREIVASNQARAAALEEERARTVRLLSAGSVPQVAVLRADAALSAAQADMASALASVARAEAELGRLIGAPADSVSALPVGSITITVTPAVLRADLIDRATRNDPAVEAALGRVVAANAGTEEARAAYWPTVSLNGGYNVFGSAAGDFIGEWQAAVQLSYPLLTGGARAAAVDRAAANAAAAAAAHHQAQLDAGSDIDAALARLAEAEARVAALSSAVEQLEAVVDIETLSLNAGAGVQTDYLRAVSDLLDVRAALTRARASSVAARITLARVTGVLDMDWLARNLEVQ